MQYYWQASCACFVTTLCFDGKEQRKRVVTMNVTGVTFTEMNGVIHRQVFPTVPVTVEYSLTEKGKDFRTVLSAMYQWGKTWEKQQDGNKQEHSMTQKASHSSQER